MAKLVFIGEKFTGRVYEIAAARTTVGRTDSSTLSIHDGSVSERHCEIYDNGADVIVRDLGSRNGTVVNGELLRNAQRPLAHGQIVIIGAVAARLEISQQPILDTATDVTAVHFHARKVVPPPHDLPPAAPGELADGTPSACIDHTLMIPRPPESPKISSMPPPIAGDQPGRKPAVIAILIALLVGVVLWLMLRR